MEIMKAKPEDLTDTALDQIETFISGAFIGVNLFVGFDRKTFFDFWQTVLRNDQGILFFFVVQNAVVGLLAGVVGHYIPTNHIVVSEATSQTSQGDAEYGSKLLEALRRVEEFGKDRGCRSVKFYIYEKLLREGLIGLGYQPTYITYIKSLEDEK